MTQAQPGAGPRSLQRLPDGLAAEPYNCFRLRPLAVTLGAIVEGLDLREPLLPAALDEFRRALREWKVLFLENQYLTVEQHAQFADQLGQLTDDTLLGSTAENPVDNVVVFARDANTVGYENLWHSDGTFRPTPTAGTVLRAIEVPPVGGDTLFVDMAAAFDNLPPDLRTTICSLRAIHDWSQGAYAAKYADQLPELRRQLPPVEHPVVIRHPETGRPTLFVNRLFTAAIVGLDPVDSAALLSTLLAVVTLPELQVRWHWSPGSVAVWDNLACQHYGNSDYYPVRRLMARATYFSRKLYSLDAPCPTR